MGARGRRDYAGGADVRVCVRACMCYTRVSGYAAHRKQTAAKIHPPHTHTEIQPHTRLTAKDTEGKIHTPT